MIKVTETRKSNLQAAMSPMKWTGSKRSLSARLFDVVPEHRNYIEPFLGGGSLLYLAAKPGAMAGDLYEPLIKLWRLVQNDPETVTSRYHHDWLELQKKLPDYFYTVRDRFNEVQDPLDLLFLTRTCVNGIIRFNSSGKFNNSFHLSRKGMHPKRFESLIADWTPRISEVNFEIADYRELLCKATRDDFVYMDPPYGGNKSRYIENLDQIEFFETLENLNSRGVKWAVSYDGSRGDTAYDFSLPPSSYKRRIELTSGLSAVAKTLNKNIASVTESVYLNY